MLNDSNQWNSPIDSLIHVDDESGDDEDTTKRFRNAEYVYDFFRVTSE